MKYVLALLLAVGALLPRVGAAQQQHLVCNTLTGAYCNTVSNPGNGDIGMPAWLAYGTSEANFDQVFAILPSGSLPAPLYGVLTNDNGVMASLLPETTGTWCLNWSSLTAEPTLASCGSGSGTVTSVGVTVPAWLTVSPATITSSGVFSISGTNEPNNEFLASASSGSETVLAPRLIVPADIPTLNQNTTGNAGTATALLSAPAQCSSGSYTTGIATSGAANCAVVQYGQLGGSVPTWNQSTTGNAATASSVPYSGLTGTVPTWNQSTTGNAATASSVPYSGLTGTVPTWNQSTTGNAATASTLASTPAQCPGGQYATGVTAAGVANCAQVGAGQLSGLGTFATQNYATPPAIGGTTPNTAAFSGLTDTAISGSTQCVQANSAGVLSGTGTACNASSGTITGVTAGTGLTGGGSSGTVTVALSTPVSAANGGTGLSALGTGVATALGINVGTAGSPVVNGGALGTPSSGSGANLTGVPISTGVSGLGTGIATALGTSTGTTGAPALLGSAATFSGVTDSAITGSTQCVQVNSSGVMSGTGAACGGSGSTGANPTASVGLATVNGSAVTFMRSDAAPPLSQSIAPTWTGTHKFTNGTLQLLGSSSGAMTLEAPAAASSYVVTFPPTTDTVDVLGTAQTFTAAKTFANSDLLLQGASTGTTAFSSANSSSTNYTAAIPANSGTVAEINLAQTFTALQTFGTDISIAGVTPTGATGTGNAVFGTNPVLVAPTLGNAAATSLTIANPLGTGYGGTGAASLAAASIPVFSSTPTAGHCVEWLSSTVLEDFGAACSSTSAPIAGQTVYGNGNSTGSTPVPAYALNLGAGLVATTTTLAAQAAIDDETGTTFAIPSSDAGMVVNRTVTSSCNDTLQSAVATGFTPYFAFTYANSPASTVPCTLTPTTSTIGGRATLGPVFPGQSCNITSDADGNYKVDSCNAANITAQNAVNLATMTAHDGVTDDSAGISTAVAIINAAAASGIYECLYIPAGVYYVNAPVTQFAKFVPSCATGDGKYHSFFKLGSGFSGPLFSVSDAWNVTNGIPNDFYNYGSVFNGALFWGFTITGDIRNSGQSGIAFYDNNDKAIFGDLSFEYINGPAIDIGTVLNNTGSGQAYMRDSKCYDLIFNYTGSTTAPAFHIGGSTGTVGDATNEIECFGIRMVHPNTDGLVVDTASTLGSINKGTDNISLHGVSLEGNVNSGDLFRAGGTTNNGTVYNVHVYDYLCTNVQGYCFHLAGTSVTPSGASAPNNFEFDGFTVTSVNGTASAVKLDQGNNVTIKNYKGNGSLVDDLITGSAVAAPVRIENTGNAALTTSLANPKVVQITGQYGYGPLNQAVSTNVTSTGAADCATDVSADANALFAAGYIHVVVPAGCILIADNLTGGATPAGSIIEGENWLTSVITTNSPTTTDVQIGAMSTLKNISVRDGFCNANTTPYNVDKYCPVVDATNQSSATIPAYIWPGKVIDGHAGPFVVPPGQTPVAATALTGPLNGSSSCTTAANCRITMTGTWSSATTTIAVTGASAQPNVWDVVTGTGFPSGTIITSLTSGCTSSCTMTISKTTTTNEPGGTTLTDAIGNYYQIYSAGSTTWSTCGSSSNAVGTIFQATAQCTGTGTVVFAANQMPMISAVLLGNGDGMFTSTNNTSESGASAIRIVTNGVGDNGAYIINGNTNPSYLHYGTFILDLTDSTAGTGTAGSHAIYINRKGNTSASSDVTFLISDASSQFASGNTTDVFDTTLTNQVSGNVWNEFLNVSTFTGNFLMQKMGSTGTCTGNFIQSIVNTTTEFQVGCNGNVTVTGSLTANGGLHIPAPGPAGGSITVGSLSTNIDTTLATTTNVGNVLSSLIIGAGSVTDSNNGLTSFVDSAITNAILRGTTGSVGGSVLTAGSCSSGTVSVTGATTAMAVTATPVTYPGDGNYWLGYVSSAGTVTVKVCAAVAGTPGASAYNVRVIQ
jgi:hypothetical protein